MKIAAREIVTEMMVGPICWALAIAAGKGFIPSSSMRRTVSSRTTMASSTTNPIERTRAIIDRLSRE